VGGDSNKVIANRLGTAEQTVKVHLKSLLRKIGATNRTQAAVWAINNGVTQVDPKTVVA
jgi:two-component system nitrate/nitrite response regulator NarL